MEHSCWIFRPGLQFLECLDLLARPTIPEMSVGQNLLDMLAAVFGMCVGHICWICWPCPQFLGCLWDTPAGYAVRACNSWDVCGTLLLDMLAWPTIPGMSVGHFCSICWPSPAHLGCLWDTSAEYAGQAYDSWDVCGTLLVDMLARQHIPAMSARNANAF